MHQVGQYSDKFKEKTKEDAFDFLYCMLNGMHNELNRVKNKPEDLPLIDDDLPDGIPHDDDDNPENIQDEDIQDEDNQDERDEAD